jgi:hypothetical protein
VIPRRADAATRRRTDEPTPFRRARSHGVWAARLWCTSNAGVPAGCDRVDSGGVVPTKCEAIGEVAAASLAGPGDAYSTKRGAFNRNLITSRTV